MASERLKLEAWRIILYWPKLHQDVVEFCKTCHTCQMVGKPQPSIKPAPMIPILAFDEQFTRVLVDCVGPLPRTKSGHQYLLTIMDLSTRFPEAILLRKITAKVVVEALMQFFTRYGLPKEVQSDQGSNFMPGVFQEVLRELGIKQLKSSAYHPQSQGALAWYHQTLKNNTSILRGLPRRLGQRNSLSVVCHQGLTERVNWFYSV